MKRSPLRRQSKKGAKWNQLYLAEKVLRLKQGQNCQRCNGPCGTPEGHHYANSKAGPNRLRFVILGSACHKWVTQNMNFARADGWQAEINGSFAVERPAVQRAEERFQELMHELNL